MELVAFVIIGSVFGVLGTTFSAVVMDHYHSDIPYNDIPYDDIGMLSSAVFQSL